ncbi:MAG: hypothetical protein CMI59_15600 [Parvibaculum sp.]|nr:hypothetical protein [Parvibaculum sp.]
MDFGMNRFWVRVVWLVGLVTVLVGTLDPAMAPPSFFPGFDKVMHGGAFAALAAIVPFAAARTGSRSVLFAGLLLVGAAIEVIQSSIPARSASFLDFSADALGIALGALVGLWCYQRLIGYFSAGATGAGR